MKKILLLPIIESRKKFHVATGLDLCEYKNKNNLDHSIGLTGVMREYGVNRELAKSFILKIELM